MINHARGLLPSQVIKGVDGGGGIELGWNNSIGPGLESTAFAQI